MEKTIRLNDGNSIPVIGLGTWKSSKDDVTGAVKFAISKAGYKHIDCASIYSNEKEIGNAFGQEIGNTVKRDELFVTSKLWNTDHRPQDVEKACKKTLSDLQLDYLDLYLMHWGIAFKSGADLEPLHEDGKVMTDNVSIQETWSAMEELVKKGLVKSIGVSNFTPAQLIDLLTYAKIKPVINQIELHPYHTQQALVDFCHYKNIAVTAYSPLGRSNLLKEKLISNLAKKYNKTPSQVLLNWAVGRGTIVIPKSITPDRISENIDIFDFELSDEDQVKISNLNKNHRFVEPSVWWGIPYFG